MMEGERGSGSIMADYSTSADVKKKKSKKTKSEDSTSIISNGQGDVTIPPPLTLVPCTSTAKKRKTVTKRGSLTVPLITLVPCSTNTTTNTITKKICFWDKRDLNGQINWFVVNVSIDLKPTQPPPTEEMKQLVSFDHKLLHNHHIDSTNGVKDTILAPVFSFPKENSPIPLIGNTFATLGSFVFSIGGLYNRPKDPYGKPLSMLSSTYGSNLVYYFDTSYRYDTCFWKQASSMATHRRNPQVIALNGKLYVFGCCGNRQCGHKPSCINWAETFDPSTGKWSALPVPEFKYKLMVCSPNNIKVNKIAKKLSALVDDGVYELDIKTQIWTCVSKNVERDLCDFVKQPVVLVGNAAYWFESNANAYDIVKYETFEGPVQDFSFQRAMNMWSKNYYNRGKEVKPATIHLGGRYFCVLAYLDDLEEDNPKRIHCMVVKVSKTNQSYEHHLGLNPFFLRARVVSCQSFPIDRELECLDGGILI